MSGSGAGEDRFEEVRLGTVRGEVACRYYRAERPRGAAVFVGGVGGGWDTPARGLYPRLCGELPAEGIACLRVRFRLPTAGGGRARRGLGAALPARGRARGPAGAGGPLVRRGGDGARRGHGRGRAHVVTLATQAYGAGQVAGLGPGCSILLLHGAADTILPVTASEHLYRLARDPKELAVFPGAGHSLDAAAGEVHRRVRGWIVRELL